MAENGNEKALDGDVQKRQVSRQCHSRGVSERSRTGCKKRKIMNDTGCWPKE